jgi:hypothetical protein
MEAEQKFQISVFVIILIGFMTLVISVAMYNYSIEKLAFEKGYEKQSVIGTSELYYKKVLKEQSE